jgi:hypothetical protein
MRRCSRELAEGDAMLHRSMSWMRRTAQNQAVMAGPGVVPNGCDGPCRSRTLEIGIIVGKVKHVETKETTVLRIAKTIERQT